MYTSPSAGVKAGKSPMPGGSVIPYGMGFPVEVW